MNIKNFNSYVKKDDKKIINNINIELSKTDMLAILGPSGSGKTTLLDFLTGNSSEALKCEGDLQMEGIIKYVAQEERLHGFYTVRNYLKFYFGLNYGHSVDEKEVNEIVEGIAESCGITSCLDTIVGDIFFKGISGGQKRRLSIALEILSKPDIIIVDEPTSGLDSYSAFKVMEVLKNLTKWGICVICTIHQPSSEIWNILDKVMVLSKGNVCYLGQASDVPDFLTSIGKPVPMGYNVADFILTHVNNDFDAKIDPIALATQFKDYSNGKENKPKNNNSEAINDVEEEVKENTNNNVNETQTKLAVKKTSTRKQLNNITSKANCCGKFISLLTRSFINLIKNPGIMAVRLFMYIMLCLMIGLLYLNLGDKTEHQDITARAGLLYYCAAFLVFMSIAVLPFYIIERDILQKEVNNSLFHPFQYLMAQYIVSLFGIALISIISTLFVVLMSGLNGFGIFFLILLLSLMVAESLCRFTSLLVPHYIIGMALVAGVYGMFMLTEGFLKVKDDIPGYLIWLYYIGFHTYSFEAFMFNEFEPILSFNSNQYSSGLDVLKAYSMDEVKIWKDCVVLIAWSLILEILSLIVMMVKFGKKSRK